MIVFIFQTNPKLSNIFKNYQNEQTSFSFRPITRDGAARLGHDFNVWSITTAAERWKIEKDMDTIYE